MDLLISFLALTGSFIFMEFFAWFTHKYIMHGFLWVLHKDHHQKEHAGFFEYNDIFVLLFASPAIYLIISGISDGLSDIKLWIGLGIAFYGMAYLFVHDIFVHKRITALKRTDNRYLKAMRKAHRLHHKHLEKENCENFGFLWVPPKYLK